MHVYTLVITPGPRRSSLARAANLLERAVPPGYDSWRVGGRFEDRIERPSPDPHREAVLARYEAARLEEERLHARQRSAGEAPGTLDEESLALYEKHAELPDLPPPSVDHLMALTSSLPTPLPDHMMPAALVTPEAEWIVRPARMEPEHPLWVSRVNEIVDQHRAGHCIVVADCHC